jgi:ADP-heptose:LPS heptosyltransferase
MHWNTTLLIHMGGLGDMCLSESTFLSLSQHFQQEISALGSPRFFKLFSGYFSTIYSIESAKWLYLFSDYPSENRWKRIVFIGKDRRGELRTRWQKLSDERLIFIDMYPHSAFGAVSSEFGVKSSETESSQLRIQNSKLIITTHVEDYQLEQLSKYGIETRKKVVANRPRNRVILYPEIGVTKSKWPHENFVELYNTLWQHGIEVQILESFGLNLPVANKVNIEDLSDIKTYFEDGGIFVSNDSGMAHFAGACGLSTITIFSDFDPAIWHPRAKNISLRLGIDRVDIPSLEAMIIQFMNRDV